MMAADSTVRKLESFLSQIRVLDDAMPVWPAAGLVDTPLR
jgi:hypothetical protein